MGFALVLDLEPADPAVFSATAATQGAHQTLDAPTGAALMGWAARHLYDQLPPADRYRLFHSGLVRFSDAVPLVEGKPVFPRPEILLKPKHGSGAVTLGLAAFREANGRDTQAATVGACRVTLSGAAAPPAATGHRLRNSRHSDALFGYAHLEAQGAVYRAVIDADAPLAREVAERLSATFAGPLLLGRARGNGYGGAYRVSIADSAANPWPAPQRTSGRFVVRLWCLSDVALYDQASGAPRAQIDPADVGLEGWDPVPAESAAHMRRYAPWNRALGGREGEIAAIAAGAVFTFHWPGPGPAPDVTVPAIIGAHRERGLGRVTLVPETFVYREAPGAGARPSGTPGGEGAQETELTRWAEKRACERDKLANRDRWVALIEKELEVLAGRLGTVFPAAAQWQQLKTREAEEVLKGDEWKPTITVDHGTKAPATSEIASDRIGFHPLAEWVRARLLADPSRLGFDVAPRQRAEALDQVIKAAGRLARQALDKATR